MPAPHWDVDDCRRFRQLRAAREHPANPQIFFTRETQPNARVKRWRRQERAQTGPHIRVDVKFLLRLSSVHGSLWFCPGTALRDVGVGHRASAARARTARLSAKKPPKSPRHRNTKYRPLVEVHAKGIVISVGNGAGLVL